MKHRGIIVLAFTGALLTLSGCGGDDHASDDSTGHHVWEHQVDTLRQAEAVADQLNTQQSEQEETLRRLRD
jgi:hypothetical protein